MIPDFVKVQTRAILNGLIAVNAAGGHPKAKIMIPLVGHVNELSATRPSSKTEAKAVEAAAGVEVEYVFGTMIEVPRGGLLVRGDVVDGLADGRDLLRVLVRDLHPEVVLELHYQLDEVERIGVEIVLERRVLRDLALVHAELLAQNGFDALEDLLTRSCH